MLINGKCHCGNIGFALTWLPPPQTIQARACVCSFCTKHGGQWTSTPHGVLVVAIDDPQYVSQYRFASETAEFHICTRCGIVPVVTSRIDGQRYAGVSVNAFEGVDPSLIASEPANFDGEEIDSRLRRRARNWIADVTFRGKTS